MHTLVVPTTPYQRGAGFERRVKDYYAKKGCCVGRVAGSRGVFDLMVACNGTAIGVQCRADGRLSVEQAGRMKDEALRCGMKAVLVYRGKNRELVFKEIL